jgi:rRNA maturation protein Nop10
VKVRKCRECGAELRHDVDNCPLCGAVAAARAPLRAAAPTNVDDYQRDIRKLREKLKKLRDGGAEAV